MNVVRSLFCYLIFWKCKSSFFSVDKILWSLGMFGGFFYVVLIKYVSCNGWKLFLNMVMNLLF